MGIYQICGNEFYVPFKDDIEPEAINASGNCFCVCLCGFFFIILNK